LTFRGVLRSEWIKLFTLRSTVWCYVILVALTVGLGVLIAIVISTSDQPEVAGMVSPESAQSTWLSMSTAGIGFAQLVIAVLGALVITGEYATGMIRSTFAAVPRRLPALLAKILVFGFVSFVVALAALVVTALIVVPIFAAADLELDVADPNVWLGLVGAAGFVALVGLMSLGIGAIIRNSAGAIAAALGLLLVAPTILQLLGGLTRAEWALNAAVFLPSSAGSQLSSYPSEPVDVPDGVFQPVVLEPLQALVVLLAWVVVPLIVGAVLVKRRDT
jgi:ABC-2 type transport system permease protein